MRQQSAILMLVIILFLFNGCSKGEEKGVKVEEKERMVAQQEQVKLPEGHPAMEIGEGALEGKPAVSVLEKKLGSHPADGEVKRKIQVPDEVKARWKTISLKFVDKEKQTEASLTVAVGKMAPIKGTRFSVKVDVFLPHYILYDTYISSKSNEPINPAVLVELVEDGKSVKKGWVFSNFIVFNTYKHDRYDIILPPLTSSR